MYNYSGQFAFQVGLPAKSGVSGIVIVVVPDVVGFATWSPPLDAVGNSARGVRFAEELVKVYNFHTFDTVGGAGVSKKKNPKAGKYEERSIQIVKLLLSASHGDKMALERAFLSGMDMNMGDYDNRTALHLACCEGHIRCVKFLIEICKVDLTVKDRWGFTPLEEAKKSDNMRIAAIIKKFMADNKIRIDQPISESAEGLDSSRSFEPTIGFSLSVPNGNTSPISFDEAPASPSGTDSPPNSIGSLESDESGIESSKSCDNLAEEFSRKDSFDAWKAKQSDHFDDHF